MAVFNELLTGPLPIDARGENPGGALVIRGILKWSGYDSGGDDEASHLVRFRLLRRVGALEEDTVAGFCFVPDIPSLLTECLPSEESRLQISDFDVGTDLLGPLVWSRIDID